MALITNENIKYVNADHHSELMKRLMSKVVAISNEILEKRKCTTSYIVTSQKVINEFEHYENCREKFNV